MTIGDNIKRYRKEKKISQAKLAELIGKSKSSIEKYESNTVTPSFPVLEILGFALGVTPFDLTNESVYGNKTCISNDEILICKYNDKFNKELENLTPLYDKILPQELEIMYQSIIKKLKAELQSKNDHIDTYRKAMSSSEKTILLQEELINFLRQEKANVIKQIDSLCKTTGDTDGK